MRFQAILQVALLIIAIVIAITVIRPKLADMSATQREIESYQMALDNIGAYNQRLQELLNQADSLSDKDMAALARFLPYEVDSTKVSRDITNVISEHNMLLLDITTSEPVAILETLGTEADFAGSDIPPGAFYEDLSSEPSGLVAQRFSVGVVGGYDNMKAMLGDFERNIYPLRLVELSFDTAGSGSGDLVEYTMILETYSLPANQ